MGSPVVCVLKKPRSTDDVIGPDDVRICVNYQYVNKFTIPDVLPLADIAEVIQKVGRSKYISLCDAKMGYHQIMVKPEHRYLTGFVCDLGLFEYNRCPFGLSPVVVASSERFDRCCRVCHIVPKVS